MFEEEMVKIPNLSRDHLKQILLTELEEWQHNWIERKREDNEYLGDYSNTDEQLADQAKYEMRNNFDQVQKDFEIIKYSEEDYPRIWKFQSEIIKEWSSK